MARVRSAKRAARRLRTALRAANDAQLIEHFQAMHMADLSSGVIDGDVGSAFIAAMRASGGAPQLTKLYLHTNSLLGPPFARALVEPTVQLPALVKLHLQGTALGDAGASSIAGALKEGVWPALEELNLSSCGIVDNGACALAVSFTHGLPVLRELNLAGNEIADIGVLALAGALFGTSALAAPPAEGGEAAAGGAAEASAAPVPADASGATASESSGEAEPTGGEGGGGEGGGPPAPLLEALRLPDNRIGPSGLEAVHRTLLSADALSNCPSLRVFDVRYQRGSLPGAAGAGRSAAAAKKAAEAAEARVAVALARLAEEAPDEATLQAATESDDALAADGDEEPSAASEADAAAAEAAQVKAEVVASAALADGEVTAETVEAAAKAAEKYWANAKEAMVKAQEAAEVAAEAARVAEAKAAEEERMAALEAAALEEDRAKERAEIAARKQIEEERAAIMAEGTPDAEAPAEVEAATTEGEPAAAEAETAEAETDISDAEAETAGAPAESAADDAAASASAAEAAADEGASGVGAAVKLEPTEVQLGRSIADGAFAEVFRGLLWGQKVAVKALKTTDEYGKDLEPETIARELQHETRILSKLNHPGVLTLIGYTDVPAQIVLEVLQGTVYDLVSGGGVEACDGGLLGPLSDVCAGCAYLHALTVPILHRDLKPPNILHDERMRLKLCDFGTAIELSPSRPPPTEWVGSQLYVAPEVEQQEAYGLPADVFSFGVLAYELFHQLGTGTNFYGEGDMFDGGGLMEGLEVLRAPLLAEPQEAPPRPSACESDAVWELLQRTMLPTPSERPTFGRIAREVGEIRQALAGGSLADWL